MKKITFLLLSFFIISCSAEEEEPRLCCTVIDIAVTLEYLNAQGENIFETESAPDVSEIEVYHKIDSEWKKYYEGNLDNPTGLKLTEIEDQIYLVVFVSTNISENNLSETKLVFPGNEEDIIATEINKIGNNTLVSKVWINNILRWQTEDQTPRRFTVVKE